MDAQQDEILEFEALEQPQPQPQPPPEPEFLITVRFSNTDPGLLMVSINSYSHPIQHTKPTIILPLG